MIRKLFAERIRSCKAIASDRSLDCLLVIGRSPDRAGDLLYLANHKPMLSGHVTQYRFRGRGYGGLVLPLDGDGILVTTTPFYRDDFVAGRVEVGMDFPATLARCLVDSGFAKGVIGVVGEDVISATLYNDLQRYLPNARLVASDDIVMDLRAVKSDAEVEILRAGALIADEVADATRAWLRSGLSEMDVKRFIVAELEKRGVEAAFATCQSGVKHSGEPMIEGGATSKRIESGDMVHMEINGVLGGYKIDICRSTVVGGPSGEQRRLLDLVLRMFEESVEAMKPGVVAEDLERITGRMALREGYDHHHTVAYGGPGTYLGHGIGLGIDEPPILAEGMKTILKKGMVITVEPGLYRTAVGGARIEDEVLVTCDGAVVLNRSDRKWW